MHTFPKTAILPLSVSLRSLALSARPGRQGHCTEGVMCDVHVEVRLQVNQLFNWMEMCLANVSMKLAGDRCMLPRVNVLVT